MEREISNPKITLDQAVKDERYRIEYVQQVLKSIKYGDEIEDVRSAIEGSVGPRWLAYVLPHSSSVQGKRGYKSTLFFAPKLFESSLSESDILSCLIHEVSHAHDFFSNPTIYCQSNIRNMVHNLFMSPPKKEFVFKLFHGESEHYQSAANLSERRSIALTEWRAAREQIRAHKRGEAPMEHFILKGAKHRIFHIRTKLNELRTLKEPPLKPALKNVPKMFLNYIRNTLTELLYEPPPDDDL